MGLLSLAIWTPIVFGVILLAIGRDSQARAVRWVALIGSVLSFLITLPLYKGFELGTSAMQFVEKYTWIERFNVHYHLGVDGISLWFVLLTAFINVIVVIAGWEVITRKVNQYMAAFLILSGLMIGVFCALDGILFYVFFEATLIPAATAILSERFPAARRATAIGVFFMGVPLGVGASFFLAGQLGPVLGWRGVFVLLGLIGLVLVAGVLALKDKPPSAIKGAEPVRSARAVLADLGRRAPAGERDPQPRGQCARCHAARRQSGGAQRKPPRSQHGSRSTAARAGTLCGDPSGGHRHGDG